MLSRYMTHWHCPGRFVPKQGRGIRHNSVVKLHKRVNGLQRREIQLQAVDGIGRERGVRVRVYAIDNS